MATTEVALPDLGAGVSSGELVAWLVEPGDRVAGDQPIAEIETDKSLVELPAPVSGHVTELRADPGAIVEEGDVLAMIDADEGAESTARSDAGDAASQSPATAEEPATTEAEATTTHSRVFAPPRVRRLARELGVDIATVDGTGDGGAVTDADVRAAADSTDSTQTPARSDGDGPREFTGGTPATRRHNAASDAAEGSSEKSTADSRDSSSTPSPRQVTRGRSVLHRRSDDQPLADRAERADPDPDPASDPDPDPDTESAPDSDPTPDPDAVSRPTTRSTGRQTTHHDEVDVTAMQTARKRLSAADVADGDITDLAFVVAAVAAALEAVPALNGSIEDGTFRHRTRFNVAVAVPTDRGLVHPVVVDADDVSLPALAREIAELQERAREGSLSDVETADATFTVADFGALGGIYADPSVADRGTSVLALGEIRDRPRVRDGEVLARAVLPLSAAVDARAIDGADAARFLTEVRRYLTTPELLLIDDD